MERPRARPAERAGSGVTSLAESSPSGPHDQANPATNTQMTICSRNQALRDGFACQAGKGRSQHAFAMLPPPPLLLLRLSAQAAASKRLKHPCKRFKASCSAPARPGPLPLAVLPCCTDQSRLPAAPLSPTAGQQGDDACACTLLAELGERTADKLMPVMVPNCSCKAGNPRKLCGSSPVQAASARHPPGTKLGDQCGPPERWPQMWTAHSLRKQVAFLSLPRTVRTCSGPLGRPLAQESQRLCQPGPAQCAPDCHERQFDVQRSTFNVQRKLPPLTHANHDCIQQSGTVTRP